MNTMTLQVGADGIALVTLNDRSKPMNVVSPEFVNELNATIERLASDSAIRGAIITSSKAAFMAGADLKYILTLAGGAISLSEAFAFSQRASAMHRRIETCGKPWVAAMNGLALGGGFELALACHYRVLADDPKAVVGLPEVTVGLLPGSGGTQRLPRMIGLEHAIPLLLEGRSVGPEDALKLGLVDRVVPAAGLLDAAREWLGTQPSAVRTWDVKGYRPSAGLLDPKVVRAMSEQPAKLAARTRHNYPAPIAILDCLYEGLMLPFDRGLNVESQHFAKLLCDPVSRNLVRTSFVTRGDAAKLRRRPAGVARATCQKIGVLGAGMMGSGIAQVAAAAGIEVILLDRTLELAEKGKSQLAKQLAKAVDSRNRTAADAERLLARITPAIEYDLLAGCDLVIEAVFEDVSIKAEVTRQAEAVLPSHALFATNTSTLPIGLLAEASRGPERFIGLHFFSPVDRMPLVEVIVGAKTSPETLAHALDFVAQLKMVPITVNDSRGFYTSRVFQTFIHEGMRMLEDGVEPACIENAAHSAGFPVGPLALVDEVTIELPWKIVMEAERSLGARFVLPCAYEVMRRMLEEFKRPGRRYGAGFYEYPENEPKRLWPGLAKAFPVAQAQPAAEELKKRFLYIQALETARCIEERVIEDAAEADLGAVLGWSYPSWTGGPISLIETVGLRKFVAECDRMAALYGPRFAPPKSLIKRAERGESYHAGSGAGQEAA